MITNLLLLAGKSLCSGAAAGLPPGPRTPASILPKSSRTDADGDVPKPAIREEEGKQEESKSCVRINEANEAEKRKRQQCHEESMKIKGSMHWKVETIF